MRDVSLRGRAAVVSASRAANAGNLIPAARRARISPATLSILSIEMFALLAAGYQFAANARVIQTAEEMQKHVLDLFA